MTTPPPLMDSHYSTIQAGAAFAEVIAAKLLQQFKDNPEKLTEILILLPTRRACRIVREAFLRQSGGTAMLLPRLQTLGDVDEDALALDIAALVQAGADNDAKGGNILEIPPAMPPLRRRIILTRLILQRPDYAGNPDQALALADALGHLLDRIHTEGLQAANLASLVDDSQLAERWQITLKFLEIILSLWPAILAEQGCIDAADRRNRLLTRLADHWRDHPPAHPVYAAGSTGPIPAVRNLLRVVAGLPQGHVILPALDRAIDPVSWDGLDETHPQYMLKLLLKDSGLTPGQIPLWDGDQPENPRISLIREAMRPAQTTGMWRTLGKSAETLAPALQNIQRISCASSEEEAALIALVFRYVQHTPGHTAALITLDRGLARRVAGACGRYGIQVDDSAGQFLNTTPIGGFLSFCAEAALDNFAPVPLLSLLKHGHAAVGMPSAEFRADIRFLDLLLRGVRPAPGFDGLLQHCINHELGQRRDLTALLTGLAEAMAPLLALQGGFHPFADFVRAHLQSAEAVATTPDRAGRERLWTADDGEQAALFFADLLAHADSLPTVNGQQYIRMLAVLMEGVQVRPSWGAHPRLSILGPMEARMTAADLVILGGVNEGSWPGIPENDPWMSRPMMRNFGLPSPERAVGLSAHDFTMGFCADNVIITRAERAGTTPTLPSRWLQRLDTVLQAAGLSMADGDWLDRVRAMDHADDITPAPRPEPRPDPSHRPSRLSVTEIETWMRDPYSVYAKRVLDLQKLDFIDESLTAADRGTVLHAILEDFIAGQPNPLPPDAYDRLVQMGTERLDDLIKDPRSRHFWGVRFASIARWFVDHEQKWRQDAVPLKQEIKGTMTIADGGFTLSGKLDRVDRKLDGSGLALIDYKTGSTPTADDVLLGLSPQLPLEAAMLREGAFEDIPLGSETAYIGYWVLKGGRSGGDDKEIKKSDPSKLADEAMLGLAALVRLYAKAETPYYSIPRPSARPRYNDYEHLARVQEWSVLDDGEGDAA